MFEAYFYQKYIRQMEDTFNRKLRFKENAEKHLAGTKRHIERLVEDKAALVSEEAVQERLLRHLDVTKRKKAEREEEQINKCRAIGLEMFGMLSKMAQQKEQQMMAQRTIRVREEMAER